MTLLTTKLTYTSIIVIVKIQELANFCKLLKFRCEHFYLLYESIKPLL